MLKDLLVILGFDDDRAFITAGTLGAYSNTVSFQLTHAVTAWKTEGTLYVVAHGSGLDFKFTQRGNTFSIDVGHCSFASLSPTSWPAFTRQVAFLPRFVCGDLQPGDDRIIRALADIGSRNGYSASEAFKRLATLGQETSTNFPPHVPPPPPPFNGMAPSYPWVHN